MHYKLALPCMATFSMQGSANFHFSNEFISFGFLRRNLAASALNKNRFDRPAQFGGRGARIGAALIGARTQHFAGNFPIDAIAKARLEGFLHAPIFARVKSQDGRASARIQARGKMAQKSFER